MRRLLVVALIALAGPTLFVPPASADGEVSVIVSNGVIYDSCDYYPYSYTPPFGYDNWSIDFQLIGPDGNEVDTDYAYDGETGATQFFICESPNLAGTYQVQGLGEACDADYNCVTITSAPASFSLRLPKTRTKLKVEPPQPVRDEVVRFIITTQDERPAGYFVTSYADVRLQARTEDGSWRNIKKSKTSTDSQGRAVLKYRFNVDRARVRAVTLEDDDYKGSKSDPVTVKSK